MKQRRGGRVKKITVLMTAGLFLTSGCASINTTVKPGDSRFISQSYKDTDIIYHRDGQSFKSGWLAKGLMKAVEPNPKAHSLAKEAFRNSKKAMWWSVSSIPLTLGGILMTLIGADKNNNALLGAGLGTLGASVTFSVVSVNQASKATGKRQDAINQYNNDVLMEGERNEN